MLDIFPNIPILVKQQHFNMIIKSTINYTDNYYKLNYGISRLNKYVKTNFRIKYMFNETYFVTQKWKARFNIKNFLQLNKIKKMFKITEQTSDTRRSKQLMENIQDIHIPIQRQIENQKIKIMENTTQNYRKNYSVI